MRASHGASLGLLVEGRTVAEPAIEGMAVLAGKIISYHRSLLTSSRGRRQGPNALSRQDAQAG